MHRIDVKLLQQPSISLDGKKLIFPYKKAEALFLYLVVEKSTSRDTISTLLWEDSSDVTAKKNLRNALYICRKLFGFDVIESPQKSNLSLVTDIILRSDYDDYMINGDFSLYHEFMHDFVIKNTNAYEEWIDLKRESLRTDYLAKLYTYITSLSYDQLPEIELHCNKYMEADPFDERIAYHLMKAYQANSLYLKGIKVYQKLHRQLSDELAIAPGQEVTSLYHQLRSSWAETSSVVEDDNTVLLPGRSNEYASLNTQYNIFRNGKSTAVLLKGETGSGKTFLLKTFLSSIQNENLLLLTSFSMNTEHKLPLAAWNPVILQLDTYIKKQHIPITHSCLESIAYFFPTFGDIQVTGALSIDIANDFNYRAALNSLLRILLQITKDTPVLIALDNFHLSDPFSQQLAYAIATNLTSNLMIIFTAPDQIPSSLEEDLIFPLIKEGLLQEIELKALSREDCADIIRHQPDFQNMSDEMTNEIYAQTSGNTFFLMEALKVLRQNDTPDSLSLSARSIISNRLSDLSAKSRQLLDILSLFENCCELDILENILDTSSLEMLDNIEELKARSLIQEKVISGQIVFSYQHTPIKEYVCNALAPSKKKLLHNVIGYAIEKTLTEYSASVYEALIYHFSAARNNVKALSYRIFSLADSSILQMELYPSNKNAFAAGTVSANSYSTFFLQLENELEDLKNHFSDEMEYEKLNASLLLTKGRCYILQGNYYNGVSAIKKVLENSYCQNHSELYLTACRQMIYYGIQLYQTDIMAEYINRGIQIAHDENASFEFAIFLRLQGLMKLMNLQFEDAFLSLQQSIDILQHFQFTRRIALINTAAAYNYMGEAKRRQQEFDSAISYYKQAISCCEDNDLFISAYVYSNLGLALLECGKSAQAFEIFDTARMIYGNTQTLMGRSICFGFCALASVQKKQPGEAARLLSLAEAAANQLGSPYEKGVLRILEASLVKTYREDYADVLHGDENYYTKEAFLLFSSVHLEKEFELLNQYFSL